MRLSNTCLLLVVSAIGVAPLAGCGGGRKAVAPVEGLVTVDGKPATSGYVSFDPIGDTGDALPGKSAIGAIGQDGRYQLSTYKQADGAIVGNHRVSVTPVGEDDAAAFRGASLPKDYQVEVKKGGNEINLELMR